MSDYKVNQKSIRVSDDVLRYIESFEGDNFNDKLSNVIYYSMKIIDDKKEQIGRIDSIIKDKEKEISDMFNVLFNLQKIKNTQREFDSILSNYNKYLEEFNDSFLKVVGNDDK